MWQAFRELYCNCRDEGGEVFETSRLPPPEAGTTTIVVSGEKFHDAWAERSQTILESEPVWKHETVHVHGGPSRFLYYRGVRAYELQQPSIVTYNIQRRMDLSEDRTIKYVYYAQNAIREGVLAMGEEQKHLLKMILFASKGAMEHDFDFQGVLPSEGFKKLVLDWRRKRVPGLSVSAFESIRPWVMNELHENDPIQLTDIEARTLADATAFCERIGFPVTSYPITVTDFLGDGVLGRAEDGTIYLSKRVFLMGAKMVAGTLLEEYFHLVTRFQDCTRDLQNYLVDALVSLGERHTGERL
jgi:hypothetical protein